jgi:hypothetical protein
MSAGAHDFCFVEQVPLNATVPDEKGNRRGIAWPATKTRNHETPLVFFVFSCFRGDPGGTDSTGTGP